MARHFSSLRNENFAEVIRGVRISSKILVLDFSNIRKGIADYENMKKFFSDCCKNRIDPLLPTNRQKFNDRVILMTKKRFLIGCYGEDRSAMLKGTKIFDEGRKIHLGTDIFSKGLEPIYSPENGTVIYVGKEKDHASYGNYVIIKHCTKSIVWYSFFGHLSKHMLVRKKVKKAEQIGYIGDFKSNENGGWSRHLHYQVLLEPPIKNQTPQGYASKCDFRKLSKIFPNPDAVLQINATKTI